MAVPTMIHYPALPTVYTRTNGTRRLDMAVIHATAGRKAGDLYTLRGLDKKHIASTHDYITKAAEWYKLVDDNDIAWHAGVSSWQGEGNCNLFSWGLELENLNNGKDPYPEVQINLAVHVTRLKVIKYNIPRSRLVRHAQIALPAGRKSDPRGFPWETFVEQVYAVEQKPVITRDPTKRYYLVNTDAATLRTSPERTADNRNVVLRMRKGDVFIARGMTFGEPIGGDNGWAHDAAERGFMSMTLLDEIK